MAQRLLVLAAVAATLALGVRWAALRLAPHLARPVAELAREMPVPSGVPPVASGILAPPSTSASASTSPAPPTSASHGLGPPRQLAKAAVAKRKAAPGPVRITRSELDEALGDRCGGASTKPVRDASGKVVALSLHSVGNLGKYGLVSGDRLVSANGLPLSTPDEALAALGALQHATQVVFVFQRGDTKFAVAVELV